MGNRKSEEVKIFDQTDKKESKDDECKTHFIDQHERMRTIESLDAINIDNVDDDDDDKYKIAKLKNCEHYNVGCYLLFGCCNEYFSCRFCHDEKTTDHASYKNNAHEHDKKKIQHMRCRYCLKDQPLTDTCIKCLNKMGNYFCRVCNFLDLDDKGQFHCKECGICRKGGKNNFFHCSVCGICVSKQKDHKCALKIDGFCPICFDTLFNSTISTTSTKCGHWMHTECMENYLKSDYRCPLCCKSLTDTTMLNAMLDEQIATTPMPDEYKDKMIDIICNDCGSFGTTKMHFYGSKCFKCAGYNTKRA